MAQDTTWTGAVLSEADINAFLMREGNGWSTYTPTLTQSGAVTKTVTFAHYARLGRIIIGNVLLTCTGAGTGGATVLIGLPVATHASASGNTPVGAGHIQDVGVGFYSGTAITQTSTTVGLVANNTTNLLGANSFTAALASGDIVSVQFTYEAAT